MGRTERGPRTRSATANGWAGGGSPTSPASTPISPRGGTPAPQTHAFFLQPPVSIASPLQLRLPNFVTYPGFEGGPSFANLPPGTVAFTQIDRVPRTVQLAISSPVASIPG